MVAGLMEQSIEFGNVWFELLSVCTEEVGTEV